MVVDGRTQTDLDGLGRARLGFLFALRFLARAASCSNWRFVARLVRLPVRISMKRGTSSLALGGGDGPRKSPPREGAGRASRPADVPKPRAKVKSAAKPPAAVAKARAKVKGAAKHRTPPAAVTKARAKVKGAAKHRPNLAEPVGDVVVVGDDRGECSPSVEVPSEIQAEGVDPYMK